MTELTFFKSKFMTLTIVFIVLLFNSTTPVPVQADDFDDFIGFLKDVEDETGMPLDKMGVPFNATQLEQSKGVITCLSNANGDTYETAVCIDDFHDTSAGQQLAEQADLPSWVWDVIDSYILYMEKDYMGLAWSLGEAVVCAVINVWTGTDICGLIEELAQLAEDVLDIGKVLIEWLGELGEAVVGAIKDAACAIGIGGCDDSPPIPPEVVLYEMMAPEIQAGLDKREEKYSGAFAAFLADLKNRVLGKVNAEIKNFNDQVSSTWIPQLDYYTQADVDKAGARFVDTVNVRWSNDIIQRVDKERHNRIKIYGNPANIDSLTREVLNKYIPEGSDFKWMLIDECTSDFKNDFGYDHIDRWKIMHLAVENIGIMQDSVQSNRELCTTFYDQNKTAFTASAIGYVQDKVNCVDTGKDLFCYSLTAYDKCVTVMGAFNRKDICRINMTNASLEAKKKIEAMFRQDGSRFYKLPIREQNNTLSEMQHSQAATAILPASQEPLIFTCYRPTHLYFFNLFYQALYGGLPQKLLKPELQEGTTYHQLKIAVENAVKQINKRQYPEINCTVMATVDPLLLEVIDPLCFQNLQDKNPSFDFQAPSKKPGFSYSQKKLNLSIDGLETPTIFIDMAGYWGNLIKNKIRKTEITADSIRIEKIHPLDPVTRNKLDRNSLRQNTLSGLQASATGAQLKKNVNQAIRTGSNQKAMSGTLPSDSKIPVFFSLKTSFRAHQPVRFKIQTTSKRKVLFELRHRSGKGRQYRPVKNIAHTFKQQGTMAILTLSPGMGGEFQIRIRANRTSPWGKWHTFRVVGKPTRGSEVSINPQPEPPGKPSVSKQLVKKTLPVIKEPHNNQTFLFSGRNVSINSRIAHAPGVKLVVKLQHKKRGHFIDVPLQINKRHDRQGTLLNFTLDLTGSYRLKVKLSDPGAQWTRWTVFNIDKKARARLKNKRPGTHFQPTPLKPSFK
ncbi:hypothetical protein DGMP_19370 [Desulfomarina profundi]|uniref:Uncharacterized protein n=1 Tax=Desulfomarina profundi TaxID=2772557 RepID=A0A8D5FN24_9BACT|nr:hypothetical protein [Desulfomarina profundi]BCL61244.1 hypothetical protein DGMP_19370 [Desulfomarina profundi]